MKYLIDGYNLLFRLNPDVDPLRRSREEIIHDLSSLVNRHDLRAIVIFDSCHREAQDFPSRTFLGDLEIIFSPRHQSADDYILEYLSTVQNPKIHTLVSSDRRLTDKAKSLGGKVLDIEAFISKMTKKKKRTIEKPEMVERHIDELRKIFEERLRKFDDK